MKEIERKFLVNKEQLLQDMDMARAYMPPNTREGYAITQGYLHTGPDPVIRIRSIEDINGDVKNIMTVKANRVGFTCDEIEFPIPSEQFNDLFNLCGSNVLYKSRHIVWYKGNKWEVDFFHGNLQNLIVAEIELQAEDEVFEMPRWLRDEVTNNPRYANSNLVKSNPLTPSDN